MSIAGHGAVIFLPLPGALEYCRMPATGVARVNQERAIMSKGMDRKKEGKKKPAKSLEEKRAAKKAKKADRVFMQHS